MTTAVVLTAVVLNWRGNDDDWCTVDGNGARVKGWRYVLCVVVFVLLLEKEKAVMGEKRIRGLAEEGRRRGEKILGFFNLALRVL